VPPVRDGVVRFEPLGAQLLELDTAAYLASPRAIAAHSAGRWPMDGFGRQENLELVAHHEREHDAGEAFAYAILDSARTRELGCAFLRRLEEYLRRTGTRLDDAPIDSAMATFWRIDDERLRPGVAVVLEEVIGWTRAWAAAPVVMRALPAEQETIAAMVALEMVEVRAHDQPLPYRWFLPR
jgi:hypothetical protein